MRRQFTTVVAVLLLLVAGVAPAAAASTNAMGSTTGAAQADCSYPVTQTDATGSEVTVEQAPERVVTLGPSATQTMWEIGGKSQVVGVTQYASYLDGADDRANVSGEGRTYVSVEEVVAQEPDLVVAANIIANDTVERLREAGLTVYRAEFATSVEDVYDKTERIGELTGNCEGASETVASMRDRIETVREAVENADSPRVLISQGGGWTAGSGTFIGNMVELAGGVNVAAETNISGYGQISEEVVVQQNPEWIVQIGQFGAYPQTEAYNSTDAVQNDQILTVTNENVSQPAPRVVNAVVAMAQAFHPDAYAEAAADSTTDDSTTTTAEPTTDETATDITTAAPTETTTTEAAMQDETTTTDESSGSIPGFGASAAVAALVGAVLLARRR
ncbi:PGF-CTERM-anchored ABC transporter substrate-binding protein [Halorussus litoreus]|uniref:PGF-CTERM-anchored ABC transporter substrate-binding protein n=1 Tax=Halorussus litoreus TaxID=1710536 RepID=UPI000E238F6C|nr:PGF-CTERM-anchored ABC transporter substrate-binding protein [Halorussus litoreus]